jgi:hypothetical protein
LLKEKTIMAQQQKLNYLPLIGLALLCLLVGVYLFARKRPAQPEPAAVTRHAVKTPADDVLKYWTEEKMSSAKAAPMPKVHAVGKKKRQSRRHPEAR